MNLENRLKAFVKLGNKLKILDENELNNLFENAKAHNSWFDSDEVSRAIATLINYLGFQSLHNFVSKYDLKDKINSKKIGVIMAGNIPMAGIHDLIVVLLSGNILYAKLSSQDPYLIKAITKMLVEIELEFNNYIHFVDQLKEVEVIIASGSDNSARYFEYYFSKYPNIIRKTRSSCAIIKGDEKQPEFIKLSADVFYYFGLGCRNVSKLYIPKNYDLVPLLEAFEEKGKKAIANHKFSNNYDYNKSIYLINRVIHLDNGYILLTENERLTSPISVLYFEYYKDEDELRKKLNNFRDKIQCIVSSSAWWQGSIDFGEAQNPQISDYADGVDTMKFLIGI